MIPGLILSVGAQMMVKSAYKKYSQVPARSGLSGAQAAAQMLQASNIPDVGIEESQGMLSDHYDPGKKVLRLSPDVYHGRSLSSLGIACHEAGHAIQHAKGYTPLYIRTAMVPVAGFGTMFGEWMLVGGLILSGLTQSGIGYPIALAGFGLFTVAVLFSIVTLPVEFDASNRAKKQLVSLGFLSGPDEEKGVSKVLNAAALTYVAAAAVALLNLLYWAMILFGRRN
ncbi:MAG: zinc metallopeptidase [Candidatus Omnitrophica bacterium]|nr:zinc metallopeptidase [Candidatus Omnitrophota bacterium]